MAFPSPEWVSAYGAAINASAGYRAASLQWTFGPVALVVNPAPALGIADPVGIWLDLDRGTCRGASAVRDLGRLCPLEAGHSQRARPHRRDHAAQAHAPGLARDRGAVREVGGAARRGRDDGADAVPGRVSLGPGAGRVSPRDCGESCPAC